MESTAVVFRMDREGVVFALFPELPADYQGFYCDCFQHSASIAPPTTTAASPPAVRQPRPNTPIFLPN